MKVDILNYIKTMGNVSFAELSRHIEGFTGDVRISLKENVILWTGISDNAARAIEDLKQEKKITMKPTDILTYFIDGETLSLPLVKGNYNYKKPHWLPVVFNSCEPATKQETMAAIEKVWSE